MNFLTLQNGNDESNNIYIDSDQNNVKLFSLIDDPEYNYNNRYIDPNQRNIHVYNSSIDAFEKIIYHSKFDVFFSTFFHDDQIAQGFNLCKNNKSAKLKILINFFVSRSRYMNLTKYILPALNRNTSLELFNLIIADQNNKSLFCFYDSSDDSSDKSTIDEYKIDQVIDAFINPTVNNFACLLDNGFNPSSQNEDGDTILHLLFNWNLITIDLLRLFLSHPKFDPNIENVDDQGILNKLCENKMIEKDLLHQMLVDILEHPNLNTIRSSVICSACRSQNMKMFMLLLEDCRINLYDKNTLYTIHCVFALCDIELLQLFTNDPRMIQLMLLCGLDDFARSIPSESDIKFPKRVSFLRFFFDMSIEKTDSFYNILFFNAIISGNCETLKLILSQNFTININSFDFFCTGELLLESLKLLKTNDRCREVIRTIYLNLFSTNRGLFGSKLREINNYICNECNECNECGIDSIFGDDKYHKILQNLCYCGHYDILMDIYIKYPNINLNITDDYGDSLLHYAFKLGYNQYNPVPLTDHFKLIKFLIAHPSIDITKTNGFKQNICHIACLKPYTEVLKMLIEDVKIDVSMFNEIDSHGNTAFLTMIYYYKLEEVLPVNDQLLESISYLLTIDGIDCTANKANHSPLYYMCMIPTSNQRTYIQFQEHKQEFMKIAKYMAQNINGIIIPDQDGRLDEEMCKMLKECKN